LCVDEREVGARRRLELRLDELQPVLDAAKVALKPLDVRSGLLKLRAQPRHARVAAGAGAAELVDRHRSWRSIVSVDRVDPVDRVDRFDRVDRVDPVDPVDPILRPRVTLARARARSPRPPAPVTEGAAK